MSLRLGFFGGSFDPVHLGHLIAAQDAFEQLGLDRLFFVPAAQAPLRNDTVRAPAADRIAMLRLALEEEERFALLDWEIERGGISYSLDTAQRAHREHPGAKLFWIIGEDQVDKLPRWHSIKELCQLIEFAYLQRPDHRAAAAPDIPGLRLHGLQSHHIQLSSSEIRLRFVEKRPLRFLLPDKVIHYIQGKKLYTE